MDDLDYSTRTRDPDQPAAARQVAGQAADAAGSAAGDVAGTAKEQAQQVAGEVKAQARSLAQDVKGRVGEQARNQNDKLADGLRRMADELQEMVRDRGDSPARTVVEQVSNGGRRVADYLADNGPEGVLAEVQDFARRRPGAFLATALAAGFVVGRLGKGVMAGSPDSTPTGSRPATSYPGTDTPLAAYQPPVTGVVAADVVVEEYSPGYAADYGSGYPAQPPTTAMPVAGASSSYPPGVTGAPDYPASSTTYASSSATAADDEATQLYGEPLADPGTPLPGRPR